MKIVVMILSCAMPGALVAAAADDAVAVALRDGSRLVGRIVSEDAVSLTVAMGAAWRWLFPARPLCR